MKKLLTTILLTLGASVPMTAQTYPFQNPELSAEERAADLTSRLTLEEKTLLMLNSSPAIPRLGIPAFEWWSEALHGIGRNGVATVFPQCIGMACSFDLPLLERIYNAVSDEGRAKNTLARHEGKVGKYRGLSFWTPNINIFRDPRWGRGQETYGEDPFMNAVMGLAVVRGLQGTSADPALSEFPTLAASKYLKLHACAKHFAIHSGPEKTRHHFNIEQLPARDLWETYLPAFKALVQEGNVQQVMCAYQRVDGDPCCGSNRLLQQILRDEWGFKGLVVSDCGAISDFWRKNHHEVSADAAASTAKAILSGTDVECGSTYKSLPEAVRRGDITEEQVDVSVRRLLKGRFELGDFDPDELVPWTQIPMSVVASKAHKQLALQMAREQTVLLKNNGVLPLQKTAAQAQAAGQRIMVMGPNAADSVMLWGIYYGQPSHSVTLLEGIEAKIGRVPYVKGCEITALTEKQSLFNLIADSTGQPGMTAHYWNNTRMEGETAATARYTAPIALDNGGNTVFAPGVELTNFTTRMTGSFVAERTETLDLLVNNDDGLRIIVNGDTIHNRWRSDFPIARTFQLKVEQGKRYDLELNYMQLDGDATLNFDIARNRAITPQDIVARASEADIVVFIGGISPLLEREEARVAEPGFDNGDRTSIELPKAQRDVLRALHEAGKRVVLVNCSGSAVALTPEQETTCDAIVQAWYPGEQGGHAIADVLFGDYNPSGKLAVTFYRNDSQLPPFDDYNMEGRTYRYLRDTPLYPFGYGLSYTTFALTAPKAKVRKDGSCTLTVKVKNTGDREGTEVVQAYIRRPADTTGPLKTLRAFGRVTLQPGEQQTVSLELPRERFEVWDEQTNTMRVVPGRYELMVGTSSDSKDLQGLTITVK